MQDAFSFGYFAFLRSPVSNTTSHLSLVLSPHDLSRLSLLHIDLVPGHYSAIMVVDRAFDAKTLHLSDSFRRYSILRQRLRRATIRDGRSAIAIYARQTYAASALTRIRPSGATVPRKRLLPIVSRRYLALRKMGFFSSNASSNSLRSAFDHNRRYWLAKLYQYQLHGACPPLSMSYESLLPYPPS